LHQRQLAEGISAGAFTATVMSLNYSAEEFLKIMMLGLDSALDAISADGQNVGSMESALSAVEKYPIHRWESADVRGEIRIQFKLPAVGFL
jgi:hypothetical protein